MYDLLNGMRVVEASAFVAGPSCGLHLAQLGAEVIRIDQIGGGPDFRRWPLDPDSGASLYWEGLNKSKKSVALDLGRPEGRELAQRIATAPGDNAGMFVTNFPVAGFLSYDKLRALRGDLICVRVMGWPDGRPALDYTVNAAIGVPAMTGPPEHDGPVNHVFPAWDFLTGALAAFSLLAAERNRRETGQGREIRLPLSDVALGSLGALGQIAEAVALGQDRPRYGNAIYGAFGRDFATADGERLMVVAITPRQWTGLVKVLGLEVEVAALEHERGVSFAKDEGIRFDHSDVLMPLIERAVKQRRSADLGEAFEANAVCWSQYRTLKAALAEDAYFGAGNPVLSTLDHVSGRRYPAAGFVGTSPTEVRKPPTPAHRLGADTDEVLAEVLGLDGAEIARLHDAGLVANA
jgi:2-methylfumaryl-CoA isomerase